MLTLAAAVIPTMNQPELAWATPAPIAITKTVSVAAPTALQSIGRLSKAKSLFVAPFALKAHHQGAVQTSATKFLSRPSLRPADAAYNVTPNREIRETSFRGLRQNSGEGQAWKVISAELSPILPMLYSLVRRLI